MCSLTRAPAGSYAIIDIATTNTFISIFATYAIDLAVRAVRSELATRNIAAKTLLDETA